MLMPHAPFFFTLLRRECGNPQLLAGAVNLLDQHLQRAVFVRAWRLVRNDKDDLGRKAAGDHGSATVASGGGLRQAAVAARRREEVVAGVDHDGDGSGEGGGGGANPREVDGERRRILPDCAARWSAPAEAHTPHTAHTRAHTHVHAPSSSVTGVWRAV